MAKTKKNVISETVDKIMEQYGLFLHHPDDADMFLQIREFVKKIAEQEYDRGMVLAQVIKIESLSEEEKIAQFQKVMDHDLEELAENLKQNKSEMKEKTPVNWRKLKIKNDVLKEETEKSEEEEMDEMMELVMSSSSELDDSDEDSNKYQTQEDIFKDLLSKILEPLIKQAVCAALKENSPSTQKPSKKHQTTTIIQGKREKLIHHVVDNILELHKSDLTVDENFAKEYLTHVVTQQFNQIANSIGPIKAGQNLSRKEWIDARKINLHKTIDDLTIILVDEMEKKAIAHENLGNRAENSSKDEGLRLNLKQKALFLTDIVAPLAKIELLSQLKESNLSLHDITKEPTIIPRRAPPKRPIQSAFTNNQQAVTQAVKIASAQAKRPEDMKKPHR